MVPTRTGYWELAFLLFAAMPHLLALAVRFSTENSDVEGFNKVAGPRAAVTPTFHTDVRKLTDNLSAELQQLTDIALPCDNDNQVSPLILILEPRVMSL